MGSAFAPAQHPLMPGGGLFLLLVGAFVMAGALRPGWRLPLLGLGVALASTLTGLFAADLSAPFGAPDRAQVLSLLAAILLEAALLPPVIRRARPAGARSLTLATLLVVALHFFLMLPAFGAPAGLLALACLANLAVARARPGYALAALWAVDGGLKLLAGAAMLGLAFALR